MAEIMQIMEYFHKEKIDRVLHKHFKYSKNLDILIINLAILGILHIV